MKKRILFLILVLLALAALVFFLNRLEVQKSVDAPENLTYYVGSIGDKQIHLIYWQDESGGTSEQQFFNGQIVFDDKSRRLLTVSLAFTSGRELDGEVLDHGKNVAHFTTREDPSQGSAECRNENTFCGVWAEKDGTQKDFMFVPSNPFSLENFLNVR